MYFVSGEAGEKREDASFSHLDGRLVRLCLVKVARSNAIGDLLPKPSTLPLALERNRRDRYLLLRGGRIGEDLARLSNLGELVPLALGREDRGTPSIRHGRFKGVGLARNVALAGVDDRREEARGGLDVGRVGDLHVRGTRNETVNPETGERNEELLDLAVGESDSDHGVPVLLD